MTSTESFGVIVADKPHPLEDPCVELPPSHVVDVDAEGQAGKDVQAGKEYPEHEVALQDSNGADENDECLPNN